MIGSPERPRLCVYRSQKHIYAQLIDDNIESGTGSRTLCSASTLAAGKGLTNNCETAKKVGESIAQKAIEKGIKAVVFDRGGYRYHGRIKSLAEGAREAGLQF
jgi:large subunit ribosomal protein L18